MKVRGLEKRAVVAVLSFGVLVLVAASYAIAAEGRVAPAARAAAGVDPPLLVPWRRVGNITLGERRAHVEREYGSVGHGYHVLAGFGDTVQGYYLLHGGPVGVDFKDGRVEEVRFATPYYRTKSGFGVGSKIPYGPCVKTRTHTCGHLWHGFVWNEFYGEKACGCWTKVGLGRRSLAPTVDNFLKPWFFIYIRHGRVDSFRFASKFVD
jgi:hypothetical protein